MCSSYNGRKLWKGGCVHRGNKKNTIFGILQNVPSKEQHVFVGLYWLKRSIRYKWEACASGGIVPRGF